jgi:hypothetical protein
MTADRWLGAASNIVAALFGMFVGLALADFPGVETWLEQWQTLIAGILAVLAAAVTIRQMQVSDAGQQRRHEHLIRMSMRSEALTVLRAHSLLTPTFLAIDKGLRDAISSFQEMSITSEFEPQLDAIDYALSSGEMKDLRPLLGPKAAELVYRISAQHAAFKAKRGILAQGLVDQNNPKSQSHLIAAVCSVIALSNQLADDCRQFAVELEALAISYGDPEATK